MNDFIKSLRVEQGDMQDIPVEDNTLEDYKEYLEHKEKRNERVFKKFGKETEKQKLKREQKEIIQDVINELRY